MVQQIGLWHVTGTGPVKLVPGTINLEKHLENWLEADPSMLQAGLTIVGRQVRVPGGIIDLLALDPQGRWIVIEVKPGNLYREVIVQALDYAASIAAMPGTDLLRRVNSYLATHSASKLPSEAFLQDAVSESGSREVLVYVVGAGRDPSLERVLSFLSGKHSVPISVISFQVFEIANGHKLLLRELSETELAEEANISTSQPSSTSSSSANEAKLLRLSKLAARGRMGPQFQAFLDAARKHNFYPRAYTEAVMFTPPNKRTRMLFTVRAKVDEIGTLSVYVSPDPFVEFYGLPEEKARLTLGASGWRHMSASDVPRFLQNLEDLLENSE